MPFLLVIAVDHLGQIRMYLEVSPKRSSRMGHWVLKYTKLLAHYKDQLPDRV